VGINAELEGWAAQTLRSESGRDRCREHFAAPGGQTRRRAGARAITGLQYHDLVHTHTQQDVELDKLFMDVCVYNSRIMGPAHVENVIQLACRTAVSRRGVAHVTMPIDMQSLPLKSDTRSARNVPDHVSMIVARDLTIPPEGQLRQAAAILAEGKDLHPRRPRRVARRRRQLQPTGRRPR
jgi:pyruvate dehydrogenase (quinone)/pyruvate oxidase